MTNNLIGIMEVYEPWVARADPSYPHAPSSDVFPWVPQQATEAHLVVSGLVECISVLVDAYPQVVTLSLPFLPAPPLLFPPPLHILTHLTQTFDNFVGFFLSKMAPYRTAEILNLPWYKWYISSTSLLLVRLIYITILFQISLSVFIILFTCFNVGLF